MLTQTSKILGINTPIEYVYWSDTEELLKKIYTVLHELKYINISPILINEIVNNLQELKEKKI